MRAKVVYYRREISLRTAGLLCLLLYILSQGFINQSMMLIKSATMKHWSRTGRFISTFDNDPRCSKVTRTKKYGEIPRLCCGFLGFSKSKAAICGAHRRGSESTCRCIGCQQFSRPGKAEGLAINQRNIQIPPCCSLAQAARAVFISQRYALLTLILFQGVRFNAVPLNPRFIGAMFYATAKQIS